MEISHLQNLKPVAIYILFLFQDYIFSQSGWFRQNPQPQGNDLYDICRNELNGVYYACGAYGTIVSQSVGNICTLFNAYTNENIQHLWQ